MKSVINLTETVESIKTQITSELPARAALAANELRNASLEVLRGQRSGRRYRSPTGGMYTASAPGEAPAARTGTLRKSWRPVESGPGGINPAIESNVPYAWLDKGSPGGKIAPRPYAECIIEKATPAINQIYQTDYHIHI